MGKNKMKKIVAMTMAGTLTVSVLGLTGSNTAYAQSGSFETHYYDAGSRVSKYTASASTDSDETVTVTVQMDVIKQNVYTKVKEPSNCKKKKAKAHVYSSLGCSDGNYVMRSVHAIHRIKVPGVRAKQLETSASR